VLSEVSKERNIPFPDAARAGELLADFAHSALLIWLS
jgi:hypothetical protein